MNQYPPGYQNPAGIFTKTDRCFVMERFLCDEVWQAKQPNRRKSIPDRLHFVESGLEVFVQIC